jgi:hypothetical protein
MTLPGDAALPNPTDQQSKTGEKTAMYRSHWELAAIVRQRNAYLAHEREICSPIDRIDVEPARLVPQLRYRLGLGLIRVGQALADHDGVRGFPTPPARPATWGPSS